MLEEGSSMLSVGGKALKAQGTAQVVAWRQEWVFRGDEGASMVEVRGTRGRVGGGDGGDVYTASSQGAWWPCPESGLN